MSINELREPGNGFAGYKKKEKEKKKASKAALSGSVKIKNVNNFKMRSYRIQDQKIKFCNC